MDALLDMVQTLSKARLPLFQSEITRGYSPRLIGAPTQQAGHEPVPSEVTVIYEPDIGQAPALSIMALYRDASGGQPLTEELVKLSAVSHLAVASLEVPAGRGELASREIQAARRKEVSPWTETTVKIDGHSRDAIKSTFGKHSITVLELAVAVVLIQERDWPGPHSLQQRFE